PRAPPKAPLRLVFAANETQDLREVDECVCPYVEGIRRFRESDGLAGEIFSGTVFAAPSERLRAHLPPEHLRRDVVACAGLLADLRIGLGLHIAFFGVA